MHRSTGKVTFGEVFKTHERFKKMIFFSLYQKLRVQTRIQLARWDLMMLIAILLITLMYENNLELPYVSESYFNHRTVCVFYRKCSIRFVTISLYFCILQLDTTKFGGSSVEDKKRFGFIQRIVEDWRE